MFQDLKTIPLTLRNILAYSFALALTKAIALPYIVIFLSNKFNLDVKMIGTLVGSSLIIGTFCSIYSGYLIDNYGSKRITYLMAVMYAVSYLMIGMAHAVWQVYLSLIVVNAAYATIGVAIKAMIGDSTTPDERQKVFSLRYTLINIAFGLGPFLGAYLSQRTPSLMFMYSGIIAGVTIILLALRRGDVQSQINRHLSQRLSMTQVVSLVFSDKRLIYYTLAGLLCSVALRQFPSYLSQYLIKIDAQDIYRIVNYVMATNSVMIISFQYFLTKRASTYSTMINISVGCLFLGAGIVGFIMSTAVPIWIASMILFSIGEMFLIPAEFAVIDKIAPEDHRGSYYAIQNISTFGGALSPIICGYILSAFSFPLLMFIALLASVSGSYILYLAGSRARNPYKQEEAVLQSL